MESQKQRTPGDVKFAENVTFNGIDAIEARQQTTEGMTQVLETFKSR